MKKYQAKFYRADRTEVDEKLTNFFYEDCESSFDRQEFDRIQRLFAAADRKTQVSVEMIQLYFHDGSFVEYKDVS